MSSQDIKHIYTLGSVCIRHAALVTGGRLEELLTWGQ